MGKMIIITFVFMAFAFYELSDGSDFVSVADEKRVSAAVLKAEEVRLAALEKAERLAAQPEPAADVTPTVVLTRAVVEPVEPTAVTTEALAFYAENVEEVVADVVEVAIGEPEIIADLREVTAARVNMRDGPGHNFDVIAKLTNGQQVEILQDPGDGWVKLRVGDTGREGWMADFLLTASNN
jgi:uncharacterized protein YgiM (DUF1202 family)